MQGPARAKVTESLWQVLLWTVIGFGAGTALLAPLVLSVSLRDRTIGGMLFGGIPLGTVGAIYGWRRGRRSV